MSDWSDLEDSSPNFIMRRQGESLDRIIELLEKLCELMSNQSLKPATGSSLPLLSDLNPELQASPTPSFVFSQTQHGPKQPPDAPSGTTESKNLPKRSKGYDTSR